MCTLGEMLGFAQVTSTTYQGTEFRKWFPCAQMQRFEYKQND